MHLRDGGRTRSRLLLATLLATAVVVAGCDTEWVTDPPAPRSVVFIYALDPDSAWVLGTGLQIRTPAGVSDAAIVYEQPFGTSGPPGSWAIDVTPPEGWVVHPDQDDPVHLEVPADTALHVVFRLVQSTDASPDLRTPRSHRIVKLSVPPTSRGNE